MPKILALASAAAPGTVTAPVALTNNVIPKGTGAATIGNSSITDNGTTVSTAEEIDTGAAGTATGVLGLLGTTSGKVSIKPQAAAGTWEFDLPITAGTAGQVLTSQGGAGTACTWSTVAAGGVTGSGTTGTIPKFTSSTAIGDSALSDDGTTVTSTEPLFLPAGSGANNLGGLQFSGGVALYRNSTTLAAWNNDISKPVWGMGEDPSFTFPAAATTSTGVIGWTNSNSNVATTAMDTSFSRLGAASVALGTAATGDFSGSLKLTTLSLAGKVNLYNGIVPVDGGVPSEVGHLDLTAQVAAIAATTIYTPTATGRFRISIYEKVTTAASVSSILGGASGTVLTFTDGTDSVAQSITMGLDSQAGAVALTNTGNSTTTSLNGSAYIYALTGVAIQIAIGYTSSGTAMAFAVRATCEAL